MFLIHDFCPSPGEGQQTRPKSQRTIGRRVQRVRENTPAGRWFLTQKHVKNEREYFSVARDLDCFFSEELKVAGRWNGWPGAEDWRNKRPGTGKGEYNRSAILIS